MSNATQKQAKALAVSKFFLIGNNLSLDFINTKVAENGEQKDLLEAPADLLEWAQESEMIEAAEAVKLAKSWMIKKAAADFLDPFKNFRTLLYEAVVT